MIKKINYILVFLTLLATYIITVVGLDISSLKIGEYTNANNINTILINLSYSFVAGLIFYLLVSYLPYIVNKKENEPIIKNLINQISEYAHMCIQSYETKEINNLIPTINKDEIIKLATKQSLYDISYYAKIINQHEDGATNLFIIKQAIGRINHQMDSILEFKSYLSIEQQIALNNIRNCKYVTFILSTKEDSEFEKGMLNDANVKKELANDFFDFIMLVRSLLNTTTQIKTSDD